MEEVENQLSGGIGKVNTLLEKYGQAPLDTSTAADISRAVGLLSSSIASLQQKDAENVRRRIARKAYEEALSQWKAWLHQWEDVASDLKLSSDPSLEGAQFFHFSEHLEEWVHLQVAEKEAFSLLGEEENAYKEVCRALQKLCGSSTSDVVELLNIASTLATTINDARSLTKQYKKETQHLENAVIRFHEAEEARKAYYADLGLDVGDIHTLERLDPPQVVEYQGGIALRLQLAKTKLEGTQSRSVKKQNLATHLISLFCWKRQIHNWKGARNRRRHSGNGSVPTGNSVMIRIWRMLSWNA